MLPENNQYKHFKGEQYYNDLYDRQTVEMCRDLEKSDWLKDQVFKNKRQKLKMNALKYSFNLMAAYFMAADRYKKKEETIQNWAQQDKEKDRCFDSAKPIGNVHCLLCGNGMQATDKTFYDWGADKRNRVLFVYNCPNAKHPRRAFFDDGEEYVFKNRACQKCGGKLKITHKNSKNKLTTTDSCGCGYKDKIVYDLNPEPKPKRIIVDRDFIKDRERFCLSKKEGEEWAATMAQTGSIKKFLDDVNKEGANEELYGKLAQIKKLNVVQLQTLLKLPVEAAGYSQLQWDKPLIGRHVVIPFTVLDTKSERGEYNSRVDLRRLVDKALTDTNWRLMSDGISYRLGILSGSLRAYETEEDMLKLAGVKK